MAKYMTFQNESFSVGDRVKVHMTIKDGDKSRIQIFDGVIMAIDNRETGKNFRVRKIASGVGVERIIPLGSPALAKVELVTKGDVRRAKLNYLRGRIGRQALKIKKAVLDHVTPVSAPVAE